MSERTSAAIIGSAGGGWDERNLRADIVSVWGAHGAHADVFDFMLAEIKALREVVAMMAEDYVIPSRVPRHDDVIARAIGNRSNEAPQDGRSADA